MSYATHDEKTWLDMHNVSGYDVLIKKGRLCASLAAKASVSS